jgi:hypothetical protein
MFLARESQTESCMLRFLSPSNPFIRNRNGEILFVESFLCSWMHQTEIYTYIYRHVCLKGIEREIEREEIERLRHIGRHSSSLVSCLFFSLFYVCVWSCICCLIGGSIYVNLIVEITIWVHWKITLFLSHLLTKLKLGIVNWLV